MTISIITVCRNSVLTIEDTIQSVVSQDYKNVEYIIIDGQSTDGTMDIIRKYKDRIACVISEKDGGIYDAINKGIALAKGEIVGILNSDDFYSGPQVLSKVAERFESGTCECVYGDLVYVDRSHTEKTIRTWKAGLYEEGLFFKGWMPPHPTFFVKRELYKRFGTFNTSLRLAADYELMLRFIHKNKVKPCYLPETLVKMRAGGSGDKNFRAKLTANMEDRKAWKLNGLKPGLFTLLMKPLSKLFQFYK